MSDINTMMQDMKTGFRRFENAQHKFEENKRKNMDRYFQQVLNQKKQKYFEDLQMMQQETGGRSSTVDQLTSRVQTLKRHMIKNKDKIQTDLRRFTGQDRQRNQIKFTEAGFPIHDYIKEMREEREKAEFKKSQQIYVDPNETAKHAHLTKKVQPQRDILKILQDEMEQERKEREERLKYGGVESLQEDERLLYEVQKQMEIEQTRQKAIIHKLIHEDMNGIDQRQFEQFKNDEMFMDEWTKSVIEEIFFDQQDSKIIGFLKELLKLADKELYRQLRDKKITLRQFKTRCMEKLNGNQFPFTDYDDVVHLIHPDCRNLDLRKVEKWSKAAFGKPFNKLPLKGEDSFINKLEDWQVQPRCLKSIANFSLSDKRRADSAEVIGKRGNQKAAPKERQCGFNFQMDERKKRQRNDKTSVSMDSSSLPPKIKPGSRQTSYIQPGVHSQKANEEAIMAEDGTDRSKKKFIPKVRKPQKSAADEFYEQIKQFQINNGYLLRMLEDGLNVKLTAEMRAKLYMTAADAGAAFDEQDDNAETDPGKALLARKANDPTYGMTAAQKERYEKRMNAKPRPRDVFNVQELIDQRNKKILERQLRIRDAKIREQEKIEEEAEQLFRGEGGIVSNQTRDAASGGSNVLHGEQVVSYKSIPNKVFGGPIPGPSSRGHTTGRSISPHTERRVMGPEWWIKTSTNQYKIKTPVRKDSQKSLVETANVVSQNQKGFMPSHDNTPMASLGMLKTQNMVNKNKQGEHSQSGDVSPSPKFRNQMFQSMTIDEQNKGIKQTEEQMSMEQIRLMDRYKQDQAKQLASQLNQLKNDQKAVQELKQSSYADGTVMKDLTTYRSDAKVAMDDISSQYREKNKKQDASSQNENMNVKSENSDAEDQIDVSKSNPSKRQVGKRRTVIDLQQQPDDNSPTPRNVTELTDVDAVKNRDASLVRFSKDVDNNNLTPDLEAITTQPLADKDGKSSALYEIPRTANMTQQTDSSGNLPVQEQRMNNVNIHLMTPTEKNRTSAVNGMSENNIAVQSDDGIAKRHPSLYPSEDAFSSSMNRSRTGNNTKPSPLRNNTSSQRAKANQPPPVIPLYQLDKYQVKPSIELKKKRLREQEAQQLASQNKFGQAQKLKKRYEMSSAMTVKRAKGNVSTSFRGQMLRQSPIVKQTARGIQIITNKAAQQNATIQDKLAKNPYQSGHLISPRARGRNLLTQQSNRKNNSSQELVRMQEKSQENLASLNVEEPRVSNQFWRFLDSMQIPISYEAATSHRNTNLLHASNLMISSERDVKGTRKMSQYILEANSSIDGMNINSQTRTGYQTSDQHMHEQSMSQLGRTGQGASVENFEDNLSGNVFSSMPSPSGMHGTDKVPDTSSQEINFVHLLNYTRKHNCAQQVLDYEWQKKQLKSQYSRSPQTTFPDSVNQQNQSPPYSPDVGLTSFEHQLIAHQMPLQERPGPANHNKHHLNIESTQVAHIPSERKVVNNPRRNNLVQPYANTNVISIEEVESQSAIDQKPSTKNYNKINTDLLPSEEDENNMSNSHSHMIYEKPIVQYRSLLNRSSDRIGNHVAEIINKCDSKLTKTTIDPSHRNFASSVGISEASAAQHYQQKSRSVMLVKQTPHGRDPTMIVNSGKFTREQLQRQQIKNKEDDDKALLALGNAHKKKGSAANSTVDHDQSVHIEMKGYSLSRDAQGRGRGTDIQGGIRETSIEESSMQNESIRTAGQQRKSDYVLRQNHRLRNVIRASYEMKKNKLEQSQRQQNNSQPTKALKY